MEKSATMNLRVNPVIKQQAEEVLKQLGIPMATAIDMYLRQISMTGSIPFPLTIPKAPAEVDALQMSASQLCAELQAGYEEMQKGHVEDAHSAFARFRESVR